MKVAIIGGGISGLGCAYALGKSGKIDITLYEGGPHIGGHSNTIDMTLSGIAGNVTHGVDTGFLVFNQRTYPRLLRLFNELQVPVAKSDMSLSVSVPTADEGNQGKLEWAGHNLDSLFAQRKNLFNPKFLRMVYDILKFNRLTTKLAKQEHLDQVSLTVGEFLDQHRFKKEFREWYFLPMIGAIWSCPSSQMLEFPVSTMIRFCHNHGLLQINDRPQWLTVAGGSREYVKRICEALNQFEVIINRSFVESVKRVNSGVQVKSGGHVQTYDHVIFATHSDISLGLIEDLSSQEEEILSAVQYQPNRAVLHTDETVLPQNQKCWAAWNYATVGFDAEKQVCVNYLINKLQPLPSEWASQQVIVSLNPVQEPQAEKVHAEIEYAHPIFDKAAIEAQHQLPLIQGVNNTWFCGAWTGYGFHEDGLRSGELVANEILSLVRANELQCTE